MKNIYIRSNTLLVAPNTDTVTLGNGITTKNVTVDRKKIITGTVVKGSTVDIPLGSTVYYPFYAADEIQLSNSKFHLVVQEDVPLWEVPTHGK